MPKTAIAKPVDKFGTFWSNFGFASFIVKNLSLMVGRFKKRNFSMNAMNNVLSPFFEQFLTRLVRFEP